MTVYGGGYLGQSMPIRNTFCIVTQIAQFTVYLKMLHMTDSTMKAVQMLAMKAFTMEMIPFCLFTNGLWQESVTLVLQPRKHE